MKHLYTPGKTKEYIRDEVFLYFSKCNHILTLPNLYFDLEDRFLEKRIKVDCTEIDKSIYEKQLMIAPRRLKLHNKDIQNLEIEKYDGLFLDMCGPFSNSVSNTLNKIRPNSKVVLTLMLARETKALQRHINIKDRETSYIRLLAKYGLQVDYYVNYTDTTPMCVFFGTKF